MRKIQIKEIVNFYIYNNIIYFIYKDGNIGEYNCANLKAIENSINKNENNNLKDLGEAFHCVCCSKMPTIFIIFNKQFKIFQLYNNQ